MPTFLRTFTMEPNDEQRLAVRPQHREHILALHAQRIVLLSGPWADDTGAYIVYDDVDEAAVRRHIADDPYTRSGVVSDVSLRAWNIVVPARDDAT